MQKFLQFLFVHSFCFVVTIGYATQPGAQTKSVTQRLVVTGSSTLAPLVNEIARRFESAHPGMRIDVQTGGSSRGITEVRQGIAAIGMVSRALKPDEGDLRAYAIAQDGIGIIVHAGNRVAGLSRDHVADIFTGNITRWKVLDGTGARITVIHKAEGRSTLELFLDYIRRKNSEIKPHIIIGDNAQGIKAVAGNPHAIGYVSIGAAEFEIRRGLPLRLLPLDGIAASVETVRQGVFPLSRPLNLVTLGEPQGLASQFIEFARSPQVHDLVETQYFIPVNAD
ncbi:MAG: phosphate ABC transporter substrate-binding protein [Nitrosomonas sp.]|nr:MAG: phosphate ABC transporter substrate-binding protein [Nitrosomonas sp.]